MPTLCEALPSFEAMKVRWEQQQREMPEAAHIIAAGLEKLEEYHEYTGPVPAYTLAMGMWFT